MSQEEFNKAPISAMYERLTKVLGEANRPLLIQQLLLDFH